ncbi:bestrophin family protein [Thermocoleostomius sinensis]|uniref:Bestrophin family ion channel n=1 Tax=Thermocoleostomius sinensis A174 TaxID=2016057 RepID=A0A9E8ZCQ6_9CYAN|nr:bestrophin family ion channel [Thermocoleostomius sinensis]WAL58845.1 bestrophin family ion channel [Thermocoleostomius sinensis A174]
MLWKQRTWFQLALQLRGSVVPAVLPRTLLYGLFATLLVLLNQNGRSFNLSSSASILLNLVLGLLLVFRTNTAYERFWEGRRLWGMMINTSRNLARHIWVNVLEKDPQDRMEKKSALDLIVAFAVATKNQLRQEPVNEELLPLLSSSRYQSLKLMNNPALEIALWLQDYLQQQYHQQCLDSYQLASMNKLINDLVDCLGGCERILKTPIPMAYAIHLKQLLLVYCLILPFQFVQDVGWLTVPIVVIISFTLFGIEEIGIEIENPFGKDPNDLQLDAFCETMKRNTDDLATLEPVSARKAIWNAPSTNLPWDH